MNGISVIICCYNSASRLPLVLEYLSKQKTDNALDCEIIIVNNNSTDSTVETAKSVWKSLGNNQRLRIITEQQAGLSFARQAGIKAALYEIIIFCDDDNLLAQNYLQHAYNLVKKTEKQGYGIWGGKPVAYFDVDVKEPDWFEIEQANYVIGPQGNKSGNISARGYVWGAGMIILKDIFLKVTNNNFPLLLTGRKENVLLAGDDSEICYRSLIIGYKLYYDENLSLSHYIPAYKLTPDYNEGLKIGFSLSGAILNKYAAFVYYVSGKTYWQRLFYRYIYSLKFMLNKLKLRSLTEHDWIALHALFTNNKNQDADFKVMRSLLLKNKNSFRH